MKYSLLFLSLLLVSCWEPSYEPNPDPNHTHADFAVWIDGAKIDFSGPEYMSGLSYDDASHDEEDEYHHEHLHLHDEVGEVLHRHKPGLNLQEFFDSLAFEFSDQYTWRMFIHGQEEEFDLGYVFVDMDSVLLTTSAGSAEIEYQLEQMTDDSCLYSRTCPWRGDPPAENCVADPAIPCVAPLD